MAGEQANNRTNEKEIDGIKLLLEWMEQQGKKNSTGFLASSKVFRRNADTT